MKTSLLTRVSRRLRRLVPAPKPRVFPYSAQVQVALELPEPLVPLPAPDATLAHLAAKAAAADRVDSRDLFRNENRMLPCWREEDLSPDDDWLSSRNYYPLYFNLLRAIVAPIDSPRLLEIGVRTGYLAVVFSRALRADGYYCGVDPNLYLRQGLQLTRRSLDAMRASNPGFHFELIQGYSHDEEVRLRLRAMPQFDLIHIDGDHSLAGKIADLELCRDLCVPGGLLLIDDFYHMPSVSSALQRAFALGWYRRFALLDTKRGLAIAA